MRMRRRRDRLVCLGGAVILAFALAVTGVCRYFPRQAAYAYSSVLYTYKVKVKTGYLALRKAQAFEEKNEIGELYNGETVIACPIDSEKDGYRYVYSPKLHKLGYVNGDYLVYQGIYDEKARMYAKVEHGYLALRNAKAFNKKNEVGKLYTGDAVIVLDRSDPGYWTVYAPSLSKAGYVNKDYLVGAVYTEPYSEPDFPAGFQDVPYCHYEWDNSTTDILKFQMEVSNFSRTKTVTAYEVVYYTVDVWGSWLDGDDVFHSKTISQTISPGETVYSDFIYMTHRKSISAVYAVIRKVRLSDGTVLENRSITDDSFAHWEVNAQ